MKKLLSSLLATSVAFVSYASEDVPANLPTPPNQSIFTSLSASELEQARLRSAVERVMPKVDLDQIHVEEGIFGTSHVRYRQKVNGIPVYGTQAIAHLSAEGEWEDLTAVVFDGDSLPVTPVLSAEDAVDAAFVASAKLDNVTLEEDPLLCYFYSASEATIDLAYRVTVDATEYEAAAGRIYYIDAISGNVLSFTETVMHALDRKVIRVAYDYYFVETHYTSRPPAYDINGGHVWDYIGYAYDFFYSRYGRDSFDNNGIQVICFYNIAPHMSHAFQPPNQMAMHGSREVSTSRAMDLVAHEYFHGIYYYVAGYSTNPDGRITNESYADMFGAAVKATVLGHSPTTWNVGSAVTQYDSRRLDNPPASGDPAHFTEIKEPSSNHSRSTVLSHGFYLVSEGGLQATGKATVNVQPLGIFTACDIFYEALISHFHEGILMPEAAEAVVLAATQWGKKAVASTVAAMYSVGLRPSMWGNNSEGWKIAFTGWTFFDADNYIYSSEYGWAYWENYNAADGSVGMWIADLDRWVWTSAESYPWYFDYSTGLWHENHNGTFNY